MKKFTRRDVIKVGAGLFAFLPIAKSLTEIHPAKANPPDWYECKREYQVAIDANYYCWPGICTPQNPTGFQWYRITEYRDYYTHKLCETGSAPTGIPCTP